MFSKYIQFRNPNPNTNFNLNFKNIISVRVRICGMYLLIMRYWYSYTRKIHSPMQFFRHSGYLALWGLGLSPSRIWYVVKTST